MSLIRTEVVFEGTVSPRETKKSVELKGTLGALLSIVSVLASLASVFLKDSEISIVWKVLYFVAWLSLIGVGFRIFINYSGKICSSCGELFRIGDRVTEVLGRGPGQFFACHDQCYTSREQG